MNHAGGRGRAWAVVAAFVASLALGSRTARAGDPYLRWYTLETPHFFVHFHGGLEPIAERTANIAEGLYSRLGPVLGTQLDEPTHILLNDLSEDANGSASNVPYDQIELFVTAPSDMSVLNDYDDWIGGLLTHEYTHILHIDNTHGIPAIGNAIFGKRFSPNQSQPRWIIEGLAVVEESRHTSAGRLRSSLFDMMLRADVLEDHFASIDQLGHYPVRWPQGHIFYLYGSKFLEYITDIYGPNVYAAVATDYGQNPIAWGINRSIRRVTGRTYPELYAGWHTELLRRYNAQADAVRARGLREGRRITTHGGTISEPQFLPGCSKAGSSLLYFRDDGHARVGTYRLELHPDGSVSAPEMVLRAAGSVSPGPDCSLVFEDVARSRRRHDLTDLFRVPADTTAVLGGESIRERLTVGLRAKDPTVSPDGRSLAFVVNDRGTTTLHLANLDEHGLGPITTLIRGEPFDQVYTPRFSPDGKRLAYSTWTHGGFRDIHVLDLESRSVTAITHDRALDQQPSWTPDGRYLLFTSDRTGIANVYAYELESKRLKQVTNVINGAYMPEVSPDGRVLVYAGYTSAGYDLFALDFDESAWLDALDVVSGRGTPTEPNEARAYPIRPYTPWSTIRPRSYELEYADGAFGPTFTLRTSGSDAVGYHGIAARLTVDTKLAEPRFALSYSYNRLPVGLQMRVTRGASPRDDYRFGDQTPPIIEHTTGITTGLTYNIPGNFEGQTVALSYSAFEFSQNLPIDGLTDPYALVPREPHRGLISLVHLGYGYSNEERRTFSVSNESGFGFGLSLDYAGDETGSESTLTSVTALVTSYFGLGLPHHVLALGLAGGTAQGTYPRRGLFFTGGYADISPYDVFLDGAQQGGFLLRGYKPGQFVGTQYSLLNVEYRFPVLTPDRGLSTLPAFLRTISGKFFLDYGGAYNRLDSDKPMDSFHASVGGELSFEILFSYYSGANLRLGAARGFDHLAPGILGYWVAAASF